MKFIIDMPDGWVPEPKKRMPGQPPSCEKCPFRDAKQEGNGDGYNDELDDFCIPGECPLGDAVEVKP